MLIEKNNGIITDQMIIDIIFEWTGERLNKKRGDLKSIKGILESKGYVMDKDNKND